MIGTMNNRAAILARVQTPDGGGGTGDAWQSVGQVWVAVEALTGGDVYGPDAVESRIRHRMTARRNGLLVAGHRLAVLSRTFHIHALLDDGPPSQIVTLLCEELP